MCNRSSISMKTNIHIFSVILYTILSLLCGLTQGQVIELNQAGNGKIDIPSPKVWIENVSFNGCVDECKFRAACTAVNFHGIFNLCELDIEPNPEVVPTKRKGLHYWIKPKQEDSVECGTQSCMSGYVCNIQKKKCEVKECSPLSIANTVILGNVNAVGAKVKMRCKEGFNAQGSTAITLTCKSNGDWSPTPLICVPGPKDCADIKDMGQNEAKTGVYRIRPDKTSSFFVRCDMETLGSGWTVIQRRVSASDFFQDLKTCQKGFGSLDTNFWLGLEQIHYISRQDRYELRVDMTNYDGTTEYACYKVFELGDVTSGYELTVNGYAGTAGDSLSYHNGQQFSTYDNDNDNIDKNCAVLYVGAWWYKDCHQSNLNGDYGNDDYGKGLNWKTFSTYNKSLTSVEMLIRKGSN